MPIAVPVAAKLYSNNQKPMLALYSRNVSVEMSQRVHHGEENKKLPIDIFFINLIVKILFEPNLGICIFRDLKYINQMNPQGMKFSLVGLKCLKLQHLIVILEHSSIYVYHAWEAPWWSG